MEEKKMTVGQRIAAYRKKKGYSQEDLAAMMNVTRQSVSRWESDATLPDIDRLITLSTLLGISLEEMLGMEKDAQEGNREGLSEEQLVRVLSEYNEESREKTKKVIRRTAFVSIGAALLLFLMIYAGLSEKNARTEQAINQRLDILENDMNLMKIDFDSAIRAGSRPENQVMSSYELKYVSGDYQKGTAVVSLDGILSENTSKVSFYAQDRDGKQYVSKDFVFDPSSGRIKGTAEVPIIDNLSWMIRTDSRTVSLHKGDSCVYLLGSLSNVQMNFETDTKQDDNEPVVQITGYIFSQAQFAPEDADVEIDIYQDGTKKDTIPLSYDNEQTVIRNQENGEPAFDQMIYTGSYTLSEDKPYTFAPRVSLKDGRSGRTDYTIQYSRDEKYGWVFEQIFSD